MTACCTSVPILTVLDRFPNSRKLPSLRQSSFHGRIDLIPTASRSLAVWQSSRLSSTDRRHLDGRSWACMGAAIDKWTIPIETCWADSDSVMIRRPATSFADRPEPECGLSHGSTRLPRDHCDSDHCPGDHLLSGDRTVSGAALSGRHYGDALPAVAALLSDPVQRPSSMGGRGDDRDRDRRTHPADSDWHSVRCAADRVLDLRRD